MLLGRPQSERIMVRYRYDPKVAVRNLGKDERSTTPLWILQCDLSDVKMVHSISREDSIEVFTFVSRTGPWQYDALGIDQIGEMRR